MIIKLKKRAKVWLDAGETVTVSPADATFLISVGAAELVTEPAKASITEQIDKPASVSKTKKK